MSMRIKSKNSMKDVTIFEILYENNQTAVSNSGFTPYKVNNYQPEWRELRHIIDFYRAGQHLNFNAVGLFSPKFNMKTKISGLDFMEFCNENKSADVVFINPFPQIEYIYYNVWEQGETCHPGLIMIANKLLAATGFNINVSNLKRQTKNELLFSNFWVGTPKFWELYVGGLLNPIARFLENEADKQLIDEINQKTQHTSDCGFLPFISERLFSTFISLHPEIKSENLPLKNFDLYFTHPTEKKASIIGKKLISKCTPEATLKKQMIRLGKVTTAIGKKYFDTNTHPHL